MNALSSERRAAFDKGRNCIPDSLAKLEAD
jgi:hypothetical protein